MKLWYISTNEVVSGPLSTEEVRGGLENGSLAGTCLFWAQGFGEWIPAHKWLHTQSQHETIKDEINKKEWHYAIDGASKGPVTRKDLIKAINSLQNKDQVLVWTKGMKGWADVYEIQDLANELGLDRRKSPRVAASGNVKIIFDDGRSYLANLKAVAEGGMGVFGDHEQIRAGVQIQFEMQSDFLQEPISGKAEVQYVTDSGYVGFRFLTITDEAKAQIGSFIKSKRAIDNPVAA